MNTANLKYKVAERYSFGWTDPIGLFRLTFDGLVRAMAKRTEAEKYEYNQR